MNIYLKVGALAVLVLFVGGVFVSVERDEEAPPIVIREDGGNTTGGIGSLKDNDIATNTEIIGVEGSDSETSKTSTEVAILPAEEAVKEVTIPIVESATGTEVLYKSAITTVFWVGEGPDSSNDFISNTKSAWDADWEDNYGGVDDPFDRCGFDPCHFTPLENPFYIALPYNDFSSRGGHKASTESIPWYHVPDANESLLKNRWVEIVYEDTVCYAQWEDVGPGESDDFAYVFGSEDIPRNIFGAEAGLDISPALRDCLQVGGISETGWRFVDEEEVPPGPWSELITSSPVNWR